MSRLIGTSFILLISFKQIYCAATKLHFNSMRLVSKMHSVCLNCWWNGLVGNSACHMTSWTSKLNKKLWKLAVSTFMQPTWARLFRDLVAMWHTHLADSKRTLVACIDLTGTTARKVKQLDQPGNHLILLLGVTEAPIAAKAPGEHTLLRVQHQLKTQTAAVCKPFCKIFKKINQSINQSLAI